MGCIMQNVGEEYEELISVVIPIYNTEQYIGKCLNSILSNDYSNLEVVCVNDGSTDSSLSIIHEYEKKDSRIRIIDIPNGGVSNARNIGVNVSTGNIIAFIDSDDFVHPQYFSIMYHFLKKYKVDMVASMYSEYNNERIPGRITTEGISWKQHGLLDLDFSVYRTCWGKLYKRELIKDVSFTPVTTGEDVIYNKELFWKNKNKKAIVINTIIYYYQQRSDSSVHTSSLFMLKYRRFNVYLEKIELSKNNDEREYWLSPLIENALGFRFHAQNSRDIEFVKKFDMLAKSSLRIINNYKLFNLKKRIVYNLYVEWPLLYRFIARACLKNK